MSPASRQARSRSAGRCGWRGCGRGSRRPGRGGDDLVEGRLGVEHHRPQLAASVSMPSPRTGPDRPACLVASSRGRASRRAACRVDGQHRDLLAAAAIPPRSPRTSSSCRPRPSPRRCRRACRRGSRRRSPSDRPPPRAARRSSPSSGSKRNGSVVTGARRGLGRRASCRAGCGSRAVLGDRGAAAARCAVLQARRPVELGRSASSAEKRWGRGRSCRRGRRHADLVGKLALERRRLVDRHLLGQRDDRHAGALVVGDVARPAPGPGGSARPARCWRTCGASPGSRRRARSPARRRSRGRTCGPSSPCGRAAPAPRSSRS